MTIFNFIKFMTKMVINLMKLDNRGDHIDRFDRGGDILNFELD
jgi:hypothetical protein